MKAAVYAGTRNVYPDMIIAAKSLALHSSVDVIYFLIEDKTVPYAIPDYVHCINVSDQTYFDKYCPNVYRLWTWMVLMRAALTKIFPDLDRILSLDIDTVVMQNIDELWDLNMDGYYFAGVKETLKSKPGEPYMNMGVAMQNLKLLRDSGMDDKIIQMLNNKKFKFAEQDCMNQLCCKRILTISSIYNANNFTAPCDFPKIRHFAAEENWRSNPIVDQYRKIRWNDIRRPSCDT